MENKYVIEFDQQCDACEGTGLYVGIGESENAAIVCYKCAGTGKVHKRIEYFPFLEKKPPIIEPKRVFLTNPGICIGEGPVEIDGIKRNIKLEDFGGMPYSDWKKGKAFPKGHEMRKFTCPGWYYQSADFKKRPDWKECTAVGRFNNCEHFCNKDKCWARFDEENI